jgi:hypothetical protein
MPYTPKGQLALAERLVKQAEDLAQGQREIVAGLKATGRPTEMAEKLLREFELGLEHSVQHKKAVSALVEDSSREAVQ